MKTLIFVYNADSGKLNALKDSLHKLISPDTYECKLCDLTHGFFSENAEWTKFLKEADFEAEFLHRDEFLSKYEPKQEYKFPIVFEFKNDKLQPILDSSEFKDLKDLSELILKVQSQLSD